MDIKLKIRNLGPGDLKKYKIECSSCSYWTNYDKKTFLNELKNCNALIDFFKSKIFEFKTEEKNIKKNIMEAFLKSGGFIKAAFQNENKIIGLIVYGNYILFPRLKEFDVFPPDRESIFIGCIMIEPEYLHLGIGGRLLIEVEKEVMGKSYKSIESIAKRINDDFSDEQYRSLHLPEVKFLVKNGFFIKKNDNMFPLLRIDLKSIEKNPSKIESFFAKLFLKKELSKNPLAEIRTNKKP